MGVPVPCVHGHLVVRGNAGGAQLGRGLVDVVDEETDGPTVAARGARTVGGPIAKVEPSGRALVELVERARMLQSALDPLNHPVFEQFEAPGRCAFALRLYGRHVGTLVTPLGDVAATGRVVEMRGMDIFELDDSLVAAVWAIADWLALLSQAGTVALAGGNPPTG